MHKTYIIDFSGKQLWWWLIIIIIVTCTGNKYIFFIVKEIYIIIVLVSSNSTNNKNNNKHLFCGPEQVTMFQHPRVWTAPQHYFSTTDDDSSLLQCCFQNGGMWQLQVSCCFSTTACRQILTLSSNSIGQLQVSVLSDELLFSPRRGQISL